MGDKTFSTASRNDNFWRGKVVLVTGGAGFLGRHISQRLKDAGADVIVPRKSQFNFTSTESTLKCFSTHKPEIVIHSAAYYGGLGITMAEPGKIYFENLMMGANLMEAARLSNVQKFVSVGTACSYPGHLVDHLKETDLWAGALHDSVVAYGSVKKMLAIQGLAYKKQYDFNSIHLIPSNLYGPYDCYKTFLRRSPKTRRRKSLGLGRRHSRVFIYRGLCGRHIVGGRKIRRYYSLKYRQRSGYQHPRISRNHRVDFKFQRPSHLGPR
jgi:nucleoside-diphosphate-sugar epimerase